MCCCMPGSPVHPHACGEHYCRQYSLRFHVGSSPRMWGTRRDHARPLTPTFIPTQWEHPSGGVISLTRYGYPHACGEHSSTPGEMKWPVIPTMWGTRLPSTSKESRPSYPHVGKHFDGGLGVDNLGSSPRMWGTPVQVHTRRLFARFIPTHVGNTALRPAGGRTRAVHPHACGEHYDLFWHGELQSGSSPRMWGTQLCRPQKLGRCRFIPTHVGNT